MFVVNNNLALYDCSFKTYFECFCMTFPGGSPCWTRSLVYLSKQVTRIPRETETLCSSKAWAPAEPTMHQEQR